MADKLTVLVCGGRNAHDAHLVFNVLDKVNPERVIVGDAKGTDFMAVLWCQAKDVDFEVFKADWEKYGKAAGPIRNQQMLDLGKPDIVVAFPGGRGTKDMVNRAMKAGVSVAEVFDGKEANV